MIYHWQQILFYLVGLNHETANNGHSPILNDYGFIILKVKLGK